MNIFYIKHSGFLIETADCYYLFDYYTGDLPSLDCNKPILVFASHRHPDHYNPIIFSLLKAQNMQHITAVLSKDIPKKNYPADIPTLIVTFHQVYTLPYTDASLYTLHSTDQGVAFLIKCPEGIFYHAGDLNDWVWEEETEQYNKQMSGSYRHEIKLLKEYLHSCAMAVAEELSKNATGDVSEELSVDIAMLPLDPRQEQDYYRGMLYFLQQIATKKVFPMHYWERPDIIQRFVQEYPDYAKLIENTEAFCQSDAV